jgi:hypothetical protein
MSSSHFPGVSSLSEPGCAMSNVRFVVWFGRPEETKVFERREDARSYAEESVAFGQQAEIRRVELSPDMDGAKMNRAAVAAMGMGESGFVEAISHPFVKEREIQEEQRRRKIREQVALTVLEEIAAEQSRQQGKRIIVPDPKGMRRGPKRDEKDAKRKDLIERVLTSSKYADRIEAEFRRRLRNDR